MFQFESLAQNMSIGPLFADPAQTHDLGSLSYIDLVGTDASAIGSEMTSFSIRFSIDLVGCEMNKAKEAFYGSLPVGMMLDDAGAWKSITMQQLVNGAQLVKTPSSKFSVQEHIRDNDAMIEFHRYNSATVSTLNYGDIAGEILSYVIIDAPNRPLMVSGTPGSALPYAPY